METEKLNTSENTDAEISKDSSIIVAPIPGMLVEGTKVSINKTTLEGVISGYHLSKDNKVFSYMVKFADENGENHEKQLLHTQITQL